MSKLEPYLEKCYKPESRVCNSLFLLNHFIWTLPKDTWRSWKCAKANIAAHPRIYYKEKEWIHRDSYVGKSRASHDVYIELKCLPFFFSIFKYVGFIFMFGYSCFKMMTAPLLRLYLCFDCFSFCDCRDQLNKQGFRKRDTVREWETRHKNS